MNPKRLRIAVWHERGLILLSTGLVLLKPVVGAGEATRNETNPAIDKSAQDFKAESNGNQPSDGLLAGIPPLPQPASPERELDRRIKEIKRAIDQFKRVGQTDRAERLGGELDRFLRWMSAPDGALKWDQPQLNILNYAGDLPRVGQVAARTPPADDGVSIDVNVTYGGAQVVLAMCSPVTGGSRGRWTVTWTIHGSAESQIAKVILFGGGQQRVSGLPADTPIVHNRSIDCSYEQDAEKYSVVAGTLRRLTGLTVMTNLNVMSPDTAIVVGPGNDEWAAQYRLAMSTELYDRATREDRARLSAQLEKIRFEAVEYGYYQTQGSTEIMARIGLATFMASGPLMNTRKPLPGNAPRPLDEGFIEEGETYQVTRDPHGPMYLLRGGRFIESQLLEINRETSRPVPTPEYDDLKAITFDTTRQRLVGLTDRGLRAYNPDERTWSEEGHFNEEDEDVPAFKALAYCAERETFFALAKREDYENSLDHALAVLYPINPRGKLGEPVPIPKLWLPSENEGRDEYAPPQLACIGDILVALTSPSPDAPAGHLHVIAPETGEILFSGFLCESEEKKEPTNSTARSPEESLPCPDQGVSDDRANPPLVGWSGSWAVSRFAPQQQQWSTWKSPAAVLSDAIVAVGANMVAILNPARDYAGWLFDLKTCQWSQSPSPEFPVHGHRGALTTFIGDRVLIWGGIGANPDEPGFALDTGTLDWARLPVAPIRTRVRAAHAVIQGRLFIWGGHVTSDDGVPNASGEGALFDTANNSWERLSDAPITFETEVPMAGVWRQRLIVFAGKGNRQGAVYDPSTRRWEALATEAPQDLDQMSGWTVAGDQVVFWSGDTGPHGDPMVARSSLSYDFLSQIWIELPSAPIASRRFAEGNVLGNQIVVWGGWDPVSKMWMRDGAMLELTTRRWQQIAHLPSFLPDGMRPVGPDELASDSRLSVRFPGCEAVIAESHYCLTTADETPALIGLETGTVCPMTSMPTLGLLSGIDSIAWIGDAMYVCQGGLVRRLSLQDGRIEGHQLTCRGVTSYRGGLVVQGFPGSPRSFPFYADYYRDYNAVLRRRPSSVPLTSHSSSRITAGGNIGYVAESNDTLTVTDLRSGRRLEPIKLEAHDIKWITSIAATDDGYLVMAGTRGHESRGSIVIFDLHTGRRIRELTVENEPKGLSCVTRPSPGG